MTEAHQDAAAPELRNSAQRGAWFYWPAIIALLVLATVLGLANLGMRFDLQQYDEGVYWETLRAMDQGLSLYDRIFMSQAPLFPLSLYPVYHLFGSTIAAARLTLVAFSLLGLLGAFFSGLLLAGRPGGLLALLLAMSPVLQLSVSRHLEAEGPANALLWLALALVLWWWRNQRSRSGLLALAGFGVLVTMGVLIKLLDVTGYALLALTLACAALRAAMRRETIVPIIGAGLVVAVASLVTALAVVLPFAPAWPEFYRQAVQFHLAARLAYPTPMVVNARNIAQEFLRPNAALCALALVGLALGAWRRDMRAAFLGGWLIVSAVLLVGQTPLFGRHSIILLAPLIALSMLAFDHAWAGARQLGRRRGALFGTAAILVLIAIASIGGFVGQGGFIASESQISGRDGPVLDSLAADLRAHVGAGQWVITDQQLAAAMAERDTPPWLVDTSWVRIDSGYLTADELCTAVADTRVTAVLFGTGRLASKNVGGFTACVRQQFTLFRDYGDGTTLWLR